MQSREMLKARKYVIAKHFVKEPNPTDLRLVEEELPPLQDGEYLVEAEFISVDSCIRNYVERFQIGTTMIGSQVAKIIESKNSDFPVGKKIVGYLGWRTHTIVDPAVKDPAQIIPTYILPDIGDLPSSLALGVLGMPGNIAYFGLSELCKPQRGKTIIISGAAGAIGLHVGQLAKYLGMTVIGICSSNEKWKLLKEQLHFNYVINYTKYPGPEFVNNLKNCFCLSEGADYYFDNVGGEISSKVIDTIKIGQKVAVGVSISSDMNSLSLPQSTILQPMIFTNLPTCSSQVTGFTIPYKTNCWNEKIMDKNLQLLREGTLCSRETITIGFENMFDAFIRVLRGEHIGKAIVRV